VRRQARHRILLLANGAIAHVQASGRIRRNVPDLVIGRLAVEQDWA
jgi:hypothetical protein